MTNPKRADFDKLTEITGITAKDFTKAQAYAARMCVLRQAVIQASKDWIISWRDTSGDDYRFSCGVLLTAVDELLKFEKKGSHEPKR